MEYRFAVAGNPVRHSLSPVMHRAALDETGLQGTYGLEECDIEGFRLLIERLRAGEYHGLNVTMPHKGAAFDSCELVTNEAAASASVNTLRVTDGLVEGHSSDVVAFRQILAEIGDRGPILVLGSGGSARAAIAAVEGEVSIEARNRSAVEELIGIFGERVTAAERPFTAPVVINATPIGMRGEALDPELVQSASALVDLPYAHGQTPGVRLGLEMGLPVYDGIDFLARQAAVSFTWWTGSSVDPGTMARAARKG